MQRLLLLTTMLLLVVSGSVYGQMLNPYTPSNAVAAEPLDPYNLWEIPACSYKSYVPCPTCGPMSAQLPDLPPIWAPFPGPFCRPVPVP
jgi:hypothetical protein